MATGFAKISVVAGFFSTCFGILPSGTADVISRDDSDFGPGSLTRDTAQELEFLDLTLTQGESYREIEAQLASGQTFEGFRFATESEVIALINNFGFNPGASAGGSVEGNTGFDQLSGLVDLLGQTGTGIEGETGQHIRFSKGLTSTSIAAPNTIYDVRTVNVSDYLDAMHGDRVHAHGGETFEERTPWVGAFLVRPILDVSFTTPHSGQFIDVWIPGNPPDPETGRGQVAESFSIGQFETTNGEFAEFLNAVDGHGANDFGVYDLRMGADPRGGISFDPSHPRGKKYVPRIDMGNKPVNFVTIQTAMRFVNWLHNGQGSGDTEDGAYDMSAGLPTTRLPGAKFWIPTYDEWFKAAYFDPTINSGNGGYWVYPTRSNTLTLATADDHGNISNPGQDVANHEKRADWNGLDGNVTTVGSAGPASQSYFGTFDQGGNVREFTELAITNAGSNGSMLVADGAFAGGSFWHNSRIEGELTKNAFIEGATVDEGYLNNGFRVAAEYGTRVQQSDGLSLQSWIAAHHLPANTVANSDNDGDGVVLLSEYAFNLVPTLTDIHFVNSGAGISGLPAITIEDAGAGEFRLRVDYVRRRGGEICYFVEFGDGLSAGSWELASNSETVTIINRNWERVIVRDSESTATRSARFGRVRLIHWLEEP